MLKSVSAFRRKGGMKPKKPGLYDVVVLSGAEHLVPTFFELQSRK
jgi:hypothetical protein